MTLDEARKALFDAAVHYSSAADGTRGRALCEAAVAYQAARLSAASGGGVAARQAAAAPTQEPKSKPCRDCGQPIVWGVFGSGQAACIDPVSLRVGFELRPGKFGPVPHFVKTRGHRLHDCPSRKGG